MCPLRIILIFLSATVAGFFLLKNFKSQPQDADDDSASNSSVDTLSARSTSPRDSVCRSSKVLGAIGAGFWTCVDMASGRYLWRHLASPSKRSS